jgi:glycosyltransferase involved in cell wall biosynthesis
LAYLTTKFPRLSETFIYEELLTLGDMGVDVRLLVFYRTGERMHSYMRSIRDAVIYAPSILSRAHLAAHWHFVRSCPDSYRAALAQIVSETWRTPVILGKSLYAFCKGVALAYMLEMSGSPPQRLHAHWATMPTTAAMVISQLQDIPFSFTAHAWDIFKEQALLPAKLRAADFAVTISEYNRRYLSQLCPAAADRIHVVRCGVNLARFCQRESHKADLPHILSVGRLVEKKGLPCLVEACAQLRDWGVDFACTIVGDGPQRSALERLIAVRGLQDVVELAGGLPQEELRDLWQMARVFVLPCTITRNGNRDGIPVALMEAMASGVPVISTAVSGIPELVESGVTGLLVPPDDAEALSQAISRLLADPGLATRLARAGRQRVEWEYNVIRNTRNKARLLGVAPEVV